MNDVLRSIRRIENIETAPRAQFSATKSVVIARSEQLLRSDGPSASQRANLPTPQQLPCPSTATTAPTSVPSQSSPVARRHTFKQLSAAEPLDTGQTPRQAQNSERFAPVAAIAFTAVNDAHPVRQASAPKVARKSRLLRPRYRLLAWSAKEAPPVRFQWGPGLILASLVALAYIPGIPPKENNAFRATLAPIHVLEPAPLTAPLQQRLLPWVDEAIFNRGMETGGTQRDAVQAPTGVEHHRVRQFSPSIDMSAAEIPAAGESEYSGPTAQAPDVSPTKVQETASQVEVSLDPRYSGAGSTVHTAPLQLRAMSDLSKDIPAPQLLELPVEIARGKVRKAVQPPSRSHVSLSATTLQETEGRAKNAEPPPASTPAIAARNIES